MMMVISQGSMLQFLLLLLAVWGRSVPQREFRMFRSFAELSLCPKPMATSTLLGDFVRLVGAVSGYTMR